jgi:hypothetical protein
MNKEDRLLDILFKVSELDMDVETAHRKIMRLFSTKKAMHLKQLERKLDDASLKETIETLSEWLNKRL